MAKKSTPAKKFIAAVLDGENNLIGYEEVSAITEGMIDAGDGDLPVDGSYRWLPEQGAFFPVGRGLGKPKKAPISDPHCLYLIAKKLGGEMPKEVKDWVKWYETNILTRSQ